MLKLLFSSLVLIFYLGSSQDIKSVDPDGNEIEVIRKKVIRSPKPAQPKENISPQAKTPPSPPTGTSGFVRAGGASRPFKSREQAELLMFEIPEIDSSTRQGPRVNPEIAKEKGVVDAPEATLVPELPVMGTPASLQAQEVRDDPSQIDSLLLPPVALLEIESYPPVKDPEPNVLDASLQHINTSQLSEDTPPFQGSVLAVPAEVSQEPVEEPQEAPPVISIVASPLISEAALPEIAQEASEPKLLPVVLAPKQYKELELEPLIFRMRPDLCVASDLSGSASLPISFYLLSLREGFLHPVARGWNFTTGLKFRFQTLFYDSHSGIYPAKQPERGSLKNKTGAELENWQTQFLKECVPYKDARRVLSEKEERVKRKEAAVANFLNYQTRPDAYRKALEDLTKAEEDLRSAEGAFTTIQEKLLLRYYRLFLHHHEKFIPDDLREQATKALAYLISVYPLKLTKPYEAPHKKPIKAFTLPVSEVDRHILMLTHRIEDMKREQGIFREIKSYYELVFKPSVQNWDWRALKNWSQLKVADPNSNPLIKAQKALNESTKSPSFARYSRQTDDANIVLSLMCKDRLGEKLEINYFSKIKPFQVPVLTSTQEASLFACSFPGIYRSQDEIVSYTSKATMKAEGKDTNVRIFGGVCTEYYKITARKHLPPELEPLEFCSFRDESFEKRRFIPIPFIAPKGVVMAGDTISFDSTNYPFEKFTFVAGDAVSLESMNFHRLLWPEVMEELEKRLENRRKTINEVPVHDENYKPSDEGDQISLYDLNQLRDYDALFKEYLELLKTQKQHFEELHKGFDAYSLVPYPFQLFQYNGPKSQAENVSPLNSLTLNKKNIEDRHLLKKRFVEGKLRNILSIYEAVNLSENRLSNPAPFVAFRFVVSLDLSHNSLEGLRFVIPLLPHLVHLNLAFNYISNLSAFVDIFEEEKVELETRLEVKKAQISEDHMGGLRVLDSWLVEATRKQKEEFEAKKKDAVEKFERKKMNFREELERKKKEINKAAENDQTEEDLMKMVQRREEELQKQEDFYERLFSKLGQEHEAALELLSDQNESILTQLAENTKQTKTSMEEEFVQKCKRIEEEGATEKEGLMRSREAQVNTTLKTLNLSHNRIRNLLAPQGDIPTIISTSLLPLSKTPPLKAQTGGIECLGRFQALTSLNLSGNNGIGTLEPLSSNTNLEELEASCCGLFGDLDATLPKKLKKLESLDVNGQMHLSFHFGQASAVQSPEEIKANDDKFIQRFPALKVLKAERRILRREEGKPILLSDLSKQLAPSS